MRTLALLSLLAVPDLVACVAEEASQAPGVACEGKCDGQDALSGAVAQLATNAAVLDALAAASAGGREVVLRGVIETARDEATHVAIEVWSFDAMRFPALDKLDGYVEAVVDGEGVHEVAFRAASAPDATPTSVLPESLGATLADPRLRTALRAQPTPLQLRRLVREASAAEETLVLELAGDDPSVRGLEVVARVVPGVERPARVRSLDAWADGILVDETLLGTPVSTSFYKGNGYFVFDDRDAFLAGFWRPYAAARAVSAVPYVAPDERVLGLVVSYSPYAGKSMTVEGVRQTAEETVVDVVLRWDAFACFEPIDDIQLVDVIKVPRDDHPVKIVVRTSTGPGCNGIRLPTTPRIAHELTLDHADRDQFFVCTPPSSFGDPFTTCDRHAALP